MSRARHLVLYDGDCAMCRFQVRTLTRLDWFNVLRFVPIGDPHATEAFPNSRRSNCSKHSLPHHKRAHSSRRARDPFVGCVCVAGVRALVMWIPGVTWIAGRSTSGLHATGMS